MASNGTDLQVHTGQVEVAVANKGGVYTTQIQDENVTDDANANTAGGADVIENWQIITGTNKVTIRANFTTALSGTVTMKLRYTITNNSDRSITQL